MRPQNKISRRYATDRTLRQAHPDVFNLVERPDSDQITDIKEQIKSSLIRENAVIIAHYYTDHLVQELAEELGGVVSDSLEMARYGKNCDADTLIVAGVAFMGETAKILTPEKRVVMPSLHATCSLDIGCQIDEFNKFCDLYPDRTIVVYANTSAAVKARADWVVTSSIAVDVIDYLDSQGEKILWAPDKYLGNYVRNKTGADMVLWDGSCIVHEEFKVQGILDMLKVYPDAAVLVHPESPQAVVDIADYVGSTSQLINSASDLSNPQIIVATDEGIFYKMQQAVPEKQLIIAPTAGNGATCRSCANCPWMAMNTLESLLNCLDSPANEVHVDSEVALKAMNSLKRMMDFRG